MLTWGKAYWPAYLIACSLAFLVPEVIALFTQMSSHLDNTLSQYARVELNVSSKMTVHTLAWDLSLLAWILFVVVMTMHIWWDQFG